MSPRDTATENLLLSTYRMLHLARGERGEYLRRSWRECALAHASMKLGKDEGALPANPRLSALALLDAVIELCECAGLDRVDVAEHFNARAEAGRHGDPLKTGEAIERCGALLSVFMARRIQEP